MRGTTAVLAARLRALSARERALVLLCGAAVFAFLLVRWFVAPAVAEFRRERDAIPARQATLERYRLASGGSERLRDALSDAGDRLEDLEEGLLPGENPAVSGSNLQGLLKPMVDRPDSRVTSVRGLPPVERGEYTEIAVQVDLQTTTEGLASVLAAVARSEKALRVKKLSVNAGYYGPATANRRETLTASLVVAGVALTIGEEMPSGVRAGGGK